MSNVAKIPTPFATCDNPRGEVYVYYIDNAEACWAAEHISRWGDSAAHIGSFYSLDEAVAQARGYAERNGCDFPARGALVMSALQEHRDNLLCELRQEIAQVAWAAGVQCDILQDYASLGDDAGLEYSLRQLSAYVRSAVGAFNQLHSIEVARESEQPERSAVPHERAPDLRRPARNRGRLATGGLRARLCRLHH